MTIFTINSSSEDVYFTGIQFIDVRYPGEVVFVADSGSEETIEKTVEKWNTLDKDSAKISAAGIVTLKATSAMTIYPDNHYPEK